MFSPVTIMTPKAPIAVNWLVSLAKLSWCTLFTNCMGSLRDLSSVDVMVKKHYAKPFTHMVKSAVMEVSSICSPLYAQLLRPAHHLAPPPCQRPPG